MKKATGIVRRIDELGRIVIPKEIRKVLKIREGESLEIYTSNDDELILKKYSGLMYNFGLIADFAESISRTTNHTVIVCDTQNIVAVSGNDKKEFETGELDDNFFDILKKRKTIIKNAEEKNSFVPIIKGGGQFFAQIIYPILLEDDIIGAIIMLSYTDTVKFTNQEIKIMEIAADYISKQL